MKQIEYAHWGMQIAQVCMYFRTHGKLPPRAGSSGLVFDSDGARERLSRQFVAFIRAHALVDVDPKQKVDSIVRATEEASKKTLSEADDAALLLATVINMSDVIAHDQHVVYPADPSMREMVDNLTDVLAPVVSEILGPDLPPEARRAWPGFARMFDAYTGGPYQ